VEFLSLNTPLL